MRDSWQEYRINEFAEVISGGTPSSDQEEYWNGNIVWITPSDLSKLKFPIFDNSIRKISNKGLRNSSATLIPKKSIVISSRAPIGYVALAGVDFTTNQGCKSVVLKKHHEPLFHYYNFSFNKSKFINRGEGTTFSEISKKEIEKLSFYFPDRPYQRKIAKILNTVDAVIEKTEAAIAKYKAVKQGMMQDLFTRGINPQTGKLRPTQKDAPGLYKETELGWIPKEWEVKQFADLVIGKGVYGINAAAVNYDPGKYAYLRITDISENGYFIPEGRKSVEHPEARNFLLSKGDIVFARTGNSTGKTYLYEEKDGKLVFAGFLIKFHPNPDKLLSGFIKFYTETYWYWNWVEIYSARTGQPGINGNEYGKLPLPTPKVAEQKLIVKKLNSINKKIESENKTLSKHQNIKKGLMQDLLTGKVEVEV